MTITKKTYIKGFLLSVIALGLIRCFTDPGSATDSITTDVDSTTNTAIGGEVTEDIATLRAIKETSAIATDSRFFRPDGSPTKNRIYSVHSYKKVFSDLNDVQTASAQKHGVNPVSTREEAEKRKSELVYIGSNPFFYVEKLNNSIPYLVPMASELLQDIGHNFFDSLQIKGVPLHKIIVTSVLRTKEDISNLRNKNSNAIENSCHQYGTTFDISYNKYKTVEDPDGTPRRAVRNDTLKWILSEVLRDLHDEERCLIKYEVKQGCFHITVN